MVGKFIQACKDKKVKLDDREGVQGLMREICEKTKNTRENRFVSPLLALAPGDCAAALFSDLCACFCS